MAYHDDLLQQAFELAGKNPENPKQADLRRAVSSAYYAVFHLLIGETVANWRLDSSRNGLARMFEHRVMARASERILEPKLFPFVGEDPLVVEKLRRVAEAFSLLQDMRHVADYDNAKVWTDTDAFREIEKAATAFSAWDSIKTEKIAQDYLVSLLIKPR